MTDYNQAFRVSLPDAKSVEEDPRAFASPSWHDTEKVNVVQQAAYGVHLEVGQGGERDSPLTEHRSQQLFHPTVEGLRVTPSKFFEPQC